MTNLIVVWWNHERMSYSCCHMLNELFDYYQCSHLTRFDAPASTLTGGILVLHGANAQLFGNGPLAADLINAQVSRWRWCIFISIGDEGTEFPLRLLSHPNSKLWLQAPLATTPADHYLIQGYPAHTLRTTVPRDLDYYFSGQVTHPRRIQCHRALTRYWELNPNGMIHATAGFNQGLPQSDYLRHLCRARIAPCPAGSATVDTFRVYEALECGAIPLLDGCSPSGPARDVWTLLLGDHPLPVIDDWATLPDMLPSLIRAYPPLYRWTQAWWRAYKHQYRTRLALDLLSLGAIDEHYKEGLARTASATTESQVRDPAP